MARRSLIPVLVLTLLLIWTLPVAQAGTDVRVLFNGESVLFEVPPIIRDDRTFVPVRFVLERIQAAVDWDGEKQEVRIQQGEKTVVLTIGSRVVLVNGQSSMSDVAPFLYQDRTMVPLRFISETFGFTVAWDATTRTVLLVSPASPAVATTEDTSPTGGVVTGGGAAPNVTGPAVMIEGPAEVKAGSTFLVTVKLVNVSDIQTALIHLHYDPTKVEAVQLNPGVIVEGIALAKEIDSGHAVVKYVTARIGASTFTGTGTLYSVLFRAKSGGSAAFQVTPAIEGDAMLVSGRIEPVQVAAPNVIIQINP